MITMKEYMSLFDRTKSNNFYPEAVKPSWLISRLSEFVSIGSRLELAKKALFHGRTTNIQLNEDNVEYQHHPNLIHAILGIAGETTEIVTLLLKTPTDLRTKVVDEGGDLLWYVALLFKHFNISFEEAAHKNIEKLKARYPEGFSSSADLNRNAEKELAAIQ